MTTYQVESGIIEPAQPSQVPLARRTDEPTEHGDLLITKELHRHRQIQPRRTRLAPDPVPILPGPQDLVQIPGPSITTSPPALLRVLHVSWSHPYSSAGRQVGELQGASATLMRWNAMFALSGVAAGFGDSTHSAHGPAAIT